MFSKQDFQDWGKKNAVLFAAVMTKIDGRKDDELLRTYGFRGFPSMAILAADGDAVTKSVPRDLYSIKNIVDATPDYVRLSADVEAGKDVDQKAWFIARLGMGKLDTAEAKDLIASVGLTGDAKAKADKMLFVLEMNELWGKARGRNTSEEDRMAACLAVYDAFKSGKRLPDGASPEPFVDDMLIDAAKSNNDKDAFFYAYDRVKKRHQDRVAQLEEYLPRYRDDIEKYKDDEQRLDRTKRSLARLEELIESTKKQIADLDATAKKLKG